jgi:hypothetical protein
MGGEMEKSSITDRIDRAESFLLDCTRDGLAHSYDVTKNIWVKPYPEVTGYLLSYFAQSYKELPIKIKVATDHLVDIQHDNGGYRSFFKPKYLFSFDTAQILHRMLSVYLRTNENKYLKSAEKCIDFLYSMQRDNGSICGIYDINKQTNVDEAGGFYKGDSRHTLQCKNIEGLLLFHKVTGDERAMLMASKLRDFCKSSEYNSATHPFGYYLEGLLAHGDVEFVKGKLREIASYQLHKNGFIPYSKDLPYAYVSGSAQVAVLMYKLGMKNYALNICNWLNKVQDNHSCGGLFQYANQDSSLNTAVHTEINSWGTKYFCELNRLVLEYI